MTMPLEFLLTASRTSLEDFELVNLEHASKLRKRTAAMLEEWIERRVAAELARLLIDTEGLRSIWVEHRQEAFDFGVEPVRATASTDRHVERVRNVVAAD